MTIPDNDKMNRSIPRERIISRGGSEYKGTSAVFLLSLLLLVLLLFSGTFSLSAAAQSTEIPAEDVQSEEELIIMPPVAQEEYTVTVTECITDGSDVMVSVAGESVTGGDDGLYHLIARYPWENVEQGREVCCEKAGEETVFIFPLNLDSEESRLQCSFTVMVRMDNMLFPVSRSVCITNPEGAADSTRPRLESGKKGLLPEASILRSGDLSRLGIQQCLYNVPLSNFLTGGGFRYRYNGRDYEFSSETLRQYDLVVPYLHRQGIQVTFVILNNLYDDYSVLHPMSRGGWGRYYAFNTSEEEGEQKLEALVSFLAERYSGKGRGTVDNWIIGNEINARTDWHYIALYDVESHAAEYERAFRIFYNIIKSANANANVYISIDQQWTHTNSAGSFSSRSFLDAFNEAVKKRGNIDWRVAMHPYNFPMTEVRVWAPSQRILHDFDTPNISMQNIDVLTDYLTQEHFLSPSGEVRTVLCSEVGYTSTGGEMLQAAAVVYAYEQAMSNRFIDGLILSREVDDYSEMAMGLHYGLITPELEGKLAHGFYRRLATNQEAACIGAAESIMGAGKLSDMLTVR